MPNITRGQRMSGLLVYLAGPGRANEHTEPHLVAGDSAILAWHDDVELDRDAALAVARELDHPRRLFGVQVPGGSVWHCSLSLAAEEGELSDERWAAVAADFVDGMGLSASSGKAPCRWVAVRHGTSAAGNDHIHLAVSLVREDGTKASTWNDRPKAQTLAGELERRHGLLVLESRSAGRGDRGLKPAELAKTAKAGAVEPARVALARAVRGCAAAAADEGEFVRRLRRAGVLARPRYAAGRDDVVVGFSVAQKPAAGQRPVWYGGGQLARDLTLPRLRGDWPDSPAAAATAAGEWTAAKRGRRVVAPGREQTVPDPEQWQRYTQQVAEFRRSLSGVDPGDRAVWARVAKETSGAFAAWSLATEPTPGPLAATAAALARSAQLRARDVASPRAPAPSVKGAALLLASAARGGKGTVGQAVLLRQLAHTAIALRDAHAAAREAHRAAQIATVLNSQLTQVRDTLPAPPTRRPATATAGRGPAADPAPAELDPQAAAAVRIARAGQVPLRAPGSPVPARLEPARPPTRTGGPDRDRDRKRGIER